MQDGARRGQRRIVEGGWEGGDGGGAGHRVEGRAALLCQAVVASSTNRGKVEEQSDPIMRNL